MGTSEEVAAAEKWLGQPIYDDTPRHTALAELGFQALAAAETPEELAWLGNAALTAGLAGNVARNPHYGKRLSIAKNAERALGDLYENGHPSLYERQWSAYEAGLNFILNRNPSDQGLSKAGRFEFTTGYGKTVLMANLASALLGENPLKKDLRMLVVVPSHFLSDQTKGMHPEEEYRKGFAEHAPHLSVTELSGRGYDNTGDVVMTTYSYFCRHAGNLLKPDDYPLIFFDEGHHILGSVTSYAVERMRKNSAMIGFTATPEANDGRHIETILPELLEKKTIIDGVLREGFLGGIQLFGVLSDNVINDTPKSKAHEYTSREVSHLISDDRRNELVIQTALLALNHAEGPGIIRCIPGDNQIHARLLASALCETDHPTEPRKIRAEAIGTHRADSTDIMRRFTDGEFDILTGINMFGEGLDIPKLAWAVYASPTKSLPQLEQFIGRLMRPKEAPALFFQVIDGVQKQDARVFGYDVFGEEPRQGLALLPPQREAQYRKRLLPKEALPNFIRDIPDEALRKIRTLSAVNAETAKIDMAEILPTYADLGADVVSLQELGAKFDMPAKQMARILFSNAYGSREALDKDGKLQRYYSTQSLVYLDYLITSPESKTVDEVSASLGISKQKLNYHLFTNAILPGMFYTRSLELGARRLMHLNPGQISQISTILQQPEYRPAEALQGSEITIAEAAELGVNTMFRFVDYYRIRGFEVTQRIIKDGSRSVVVLNREAVTAHIEAYLNAQQLPNFGYTPVSRKDNRLATLHALAAEHGIQFHFFAYKDTVREYLSNVDFGHLHQLLREEEAAQPPQADTEDEVTYFVVRQAPIKHTDVSKQAPKEPQEGPRAQEENVAVPDATSYILLADVSDSVPVIPSDATFADIMKSLGIHPVIKDGLVMITADQARRIRKTVADKNKSESDTEAKLKRTQHSTRRASASRVLSRHVPTRPVAGKPNMSTKQIEAAYTDHFLRSLLPTIPQRQHNTTEFDFGYTSLRALSQLSEQPVVTIIKLLQASMQGNTLPVARTGSDLLINQKIRLVIASALNAAQTIPPTWVTAQALGSRGVTLKTIENYAAKDPTNIRTIVLRERDTDVSNSDNPSGTAIRKPNYGVYYFVSPELARRLVFSV